MARPGVMLYFDMLEPIRVLPDEDKGRLLVAILEYGKDGVVPEFSGMLMVSMPRAARVHMVCFLL